MMTPNGTEPQTVSSLASDLAGSKPLLENMTDSAAEGIARLDLLDPPGRKRIRPELPRVRERIPEPLADAIARCVAGLSPWPLYVFGGAGTGKTRAGLYLCDRTHGTARFADYVDLCDELREAKLGELRREYAYGDVVKISVSRLWSEWQSAELAVLDEIGARGSVSDCQYEAMKGAIDRRECRPLMLLANLDLGQIARLFDDRIASRCAAGTVLELAASDQRIEKVF